MLAVAVGLSLSIKARASDYSAAADEPRLIHDVSSALQRQRFTTKVERHLFPEETIVAMRDACQLRVTNGTRANELIAVLRTQAHDVGNVRYYYLHQWLVDPPTFRSEVSRYMQRTLARLGVRRSRDVVLAVAASSGCGTNDFDLSGMKIYMAT